MENIEVRAVEPVQIVHGRVFDDVTVRITAAAADYEVDPAGKIVFGDRTVRPFTEDWTFQRSVGVATLNKPGTLENTCPSCGAPVSLNQIGECRYCKAAVTSGKFDWVVSRIEQEAETRLLEECPLTPLYFNATNWLMRPAVRGWHQDALWTRFYQDVYLHED